ncbi:uncharacterized protein DNG_06253 [Cephalotrichum gorgonifer]|uniref:ABM domain-containing protein n=1 Tax=Cephalotrichum gorgonifer TaxID=2041049 RepID=A0AAE8SW95_9PEZI|nr:uncharacterized protein DNG_06253 [Cephalotrichum gorgonifer]
MAPVNIVAILTPAPGKVDRLRDLLTAQASIVHEKEDYALRFVVTEQIDNDVPEFIAIETYESKEAAGRHTKEPHFAEFFKALADEGVLAKPPVLWHTKSLGGFELDRKLNAAA